MKQKRHFVRIKSMRKRFTLCQWRS